MIWILFLLSIYAISIQYSSISCYNNFTFLQCNTSDLNFSIEAIGNIHHYNFTYSFYGNRSQYYAIFYIDGGVFSKIRLWKSNDSIIFAPNQRATIDISNENTLLASILLNKTSPIIYSLQTTPITPLIDAVSNLFNLYSVPLSLIFLLIISNLSGFPLIYKVAVISMGSFILGLVYQNPIFYMIALIGLLAIGLLKFGGR